MSKKQSRGLGRGLSALMADVNLEPEGTSEGGDQKQPDQFLPIEKIVPNPDQPRRHFSEDLLRDLADSIREKGVIQPLIVRPAKVEGQFEIVAGERRWRAAQLAKLHKLPVLVRDYTDTETLEVAIIENIQRADLNAVEEAKGYQDLINRFGHTQEQLANSLGKSRSHIANMMRLLKLPAGVQKLLESGELSSGHARALVGREDAEEVARSIVAKGMSVRDVEALTKSEKKRKKTNPKPKKDSDTIALEQDLSAALGMAVVIDHEGETGRGKLTVKYNDLDSLDDLCKKLGI